MKIKGFTIETNNKSSCNKCQEHIGNYYENADDLPKIPFHYGCKCFYKADIEEIDESIYTEVKKYQMQRIYFLNLLTTLYPLYFLLF